MWKQAGSCETRHGSGLHHSCAPDPPKATSLAPRLRRWRSLVCHVPGALRHAKTPDGKPLVQGKRVTGFTNTEEEAVGLPKVAPFLVEDELKAKGGWLS